MHTSEQAHAGNHLAVPPSIHQASNGSGVGGESQVNLHRIMKNEIACATSLLLRNAEHRLLNCLQLLYPANSILVLNVALASDLLL